MKGLLAVLILVVAGGAAAAAQEPTAESLRKVEGQTIHSHEMPRADLTFGRDFHYVGGQRVNLYGNADAEQHIFVVSNDRMVERFYWVQFEHFLPSNKHTYNYPAERTTDIGGLRFVYDVKSWQDYAGNELEDPASDGAAISRLLDEHNLLFPKRAARVRMFHLPAADRRTELMIIYGERLPDGAAVPIREGGVEMDKEAPEAARMFLERARKDLNIQKK